MTWHETWLNNSSALFDHFSNFWNWTKSANTWLSTKLPKFFGHFSNFGNEKLDNSLADLSRNFARTRPASAESENWGAQVAAPLRHTEAPPSPVAKVDRATADDRVFHLKFRLFENLLRVIVKWPSLNRDLWMALMNFQFVQNKF